MDIAINRLDIKRVLTLVSAVLFSCILLVGCKDSATGNDELNKSTKTYDLVLASGGSTIGKLTTERITEEDDAYIDEGFFVTLNIQNSDYQAPYDIHINNTDGYCGTFGVESGDQAEMPCDYDNFLSNPEELTVTSEDGDGLEANPSP